MARPTDKATLESAARLGFEELEQSIAALPACWRTAVLPVDGRDRSVRDVMWHLHEWHLMMTRWYEDGMAGRQPAMPTEGHTWRTTSALNEEIQQRAQHVSHDDALRALRPSHDTVLGLISHHTDEELFTRRHYAWTGTTHLGSYLTSATSSHYAWARKTLRRFIREMRQTAGQKSEGQ